MTITTQVAVAKIIGIQKQDAWSRRNVGRSRADERGEQHYRKK
jgi:hypothetical protein